MSAESHANINLKTLNKLLKENTDKLPTIKTLIPDLEDVLDGKRQLSIYEMNRIAKTLKINMVSMYLAPEVYEKAYEYYKIIHQCKKLEEHVGFMNKFGIHFTKTYDEFLLEGAKFCPYCGFKIS